MIVDGAGVNCHVVTYRYVVADMSWARFVGDVYARAVLDVRAVADSDGSYVATHDGIEPY